MADVVAIGALPQARRFSELTPEASHFKAFRTQWKQKETSRVVALAFCPVKPHRLAVVSGTKVSLWQAGKGGAAQHASNLSKFKDMTQCMSWRNDGKLLLAGEAGGSCAVIESESKNVLRRLRGHGDAVTCCAFATADRSRCATGGRDGKLRLWDVATSDLLHTVDAHSDSMQVLAPGPGGSDVWVTGGRDGQVRLWDLRIGGGTGNAGDAASSSSSSASAVVTVDHGSPVESGCAFPGGALFASAGGTEVKVWDLAASGKAVHTLAGAHSKVITSVCLDSDASVMMTASFDGFAKVFGAATMEHLWTYRLPGPATCASWRPDAKAFAIGMDDGQWQMRLLRAPSTEEGEAAAQKKRKSYASALGRFRGKDEQPASDDEVIEPEKPYKRRESQLDYYMRKFEYRKVLETIVQGEGVHFEHSLAAVEELLQRGALATSLTEIGEPLCLATLRWLLKVFGGADSLRTQLFMETLHTLMDCNKCLQPPSTLELVDAVEKIENKVTTEVKIQEAMMETSGMLRAVTSSC